MINNLFGNINKLTRWLVRKNKTCENTIAQISIEMFGNPNYTK